MTIKLKEPIHALFQLAFSLVSLRPRPGAASHARSERTRLWSGAAPYRGLWRTQLGSNAGLSVWRSAVS